MDMNYAYVAGLIDGEGCIHLDYTRRNPMKPTFRPRVSVGMTEPAKFLLQELKDEWGGTLYQLRKPTEKWAGAWTWHLTGPEASNLIREIRPYLRLKTGQADLLLEVDEIWQALSKTASGQGRWTKEARDACEGILIQLTQLNRKGPRVDAQIAEVA